MHENTDRVAGAQKSAPGSYYALTYGTSGVNPSWSPTGSFTYEKVGTKWTVAHVDYTVEGKPVRTYNATFATLTLATKFAEQVVRDLPANRARRREATLKGAMPVGGRPAPAPREEATQSVIAVGDRVQVIAHPEQTGTVTAVSDSGIHVVLDRPINLSVGATPIDSLWRDASELVALTREGATFAVVCDILADPEWTRRVVAAAVVAEDVLERGGPAQLVLADALRDRNRVVR